ncbi:MAG: leucine--tRNA ligase [Deltaproteobacteria bacterium]|nr:leucine--tRNA ligase [Deltaproteobacteria bacterium]
MSNIHDKDRYLPSEIEPRWQAFWDEHRTFETRRKPGSPKLYVLDMFPYPSGSGLHVGHPEGYTATDIVARHARMKGVDVLHPMGWDAFGLPAEQYAIQTGTHPSAKTAENIQTFRRQLKMLGFSYDWSREVNTTDPSYVRWTQWIFLQLFRRGLAVQSEIPVNWCPDLGTVLANEEVIDGKSERGGFPVLRQPLRQWLLRITAYADRLAGDLDLLEWPDTKQKQLNWIGRSEGVEIDFKVDGADEKLRVFTTRPDTLFGATYMVIAPEHPAVDRITTAEQKPEVQSYVAAAIVKSDMDRTALAKTKTGVSTGAFAINPVNGERIPIWVADYVLGAYGTGAVMAVPGHDERDFEFAGQYGLPIVEVVSPDGALHDSLSAAFVDDGVAVRSGQFDGLRTPEMKQKITDHLASLGIAARKVNYKLRDWVFSRQRYWGEPFPIYFPVDLDDPSADPRTGAPHKVRYDQPIAVEDSELPVRLPDLTDFRPGNDPRGPLARAVDWVYFQKEGRWFARETNTMPQWAGSCWYYLRFLDPSNEERIFSEQAYDDWMPVDLYVGGSEHAVLHLLYARFWHKVLFDVGVVKHPEPFIKLVHQGMILGENNEKMSKARGNVINPDDVVREFGADSLRIYEMFMGPLEQVKPWQTSGIQGARRFLERTWKICNGELCEAIDEETARLLHKTIKKVGDDIDSMRFNTAVSALMILSNHLASLEACPRQAARALVLLLSPFAPHIAEELWSRLGGAQTLAFEPWPTYDENLVRDDTVEIGVQVNGKVRGRIMLAKDASEQQALELARAEKNIAMYLEGKGLKKVIYKPGLILNIIVDK